MVLLVLALIWAVVLIPPALRNRAEGRPSDSIAAFRRQLAVLDRAGPRAFGPDPDDRGYGPGPAGPARLPRHSGVHAGVTMASRPAVAHRAAVARRSSVRRRRRDVLVGLLVAAGATLVLGTAPALRFMWAAHVVVDVLLIAYVALLVRQRNLAAERALKVRFLPGPRPIDDRSWSRSESAWLAN